ncbi:hypothetical protein PGW94_02720 [Candidatus Anaplasma sp. TIGMIC]|nr:hypothetical protein [Candidatus Anaplasma sp. TIGMIC]
MEVVFVSGCFFLLQTAGTSKMVIEILIFPVATAHCPHHATGAAVYVDMRDRRLAIRQEVTIANRVEMWHLTERDVRQYQLLYFMAVFYIWFCRMHRILKVDTSMLKNNIQQESKLGAVTAENVDVMAQKRYSP